MPLSIDSLAAVRETLYLSYFWRKENETERPYWLFNAFLGTQSSHFVTEDEALAAAVTFVNRAYIFNCIAFFKGAHDMSHKESEAWSLALEAIKNTQNKRLSVIQLFKTLQCIDYNTDARGWFSSKKYEKWDRRFEYEAFKEQIERTKRYLAEEVIIPRLPEYQAAKWG